MAQFDVLQLRSGEWVIDCQTDILAGISSRFVVPLNLPEDSPPVHPRLNPIFEIGGEQRVMVTQFAGAVTITEIAGRQTSLAREEYRIKNALDMLLSGI